MKILLSAILAVLLAVSPASAAFNFNGSNQNFVISDHPVLDNPDSDWTWAFMWLQNVAPGGVPQHIIANSTTAAGNPGFLVICDALSNLVVRNNDVSTGDQTASSSGAECDTTGVWRRVIIQHTGDTLTVYLNSTQVGTSTATVGNSSGPAGGLYFGTDPAGADDFNGAVADIAKWSRLLTADERKALNEFSARLFLNDLQLFIPAIRDYIELLGPLTIINGGSTVVTHPRLFFPN